MLLPKDPFLLLGQAAFSDGLSLLDTTSSSPIASCGLRAWRKESITLFLLEITILFSGFGLPNAISCDFFPSLPWLSELTCQVLKVMAFQKAEEIPGLKLVKPSSLQLDLDSESKLFLCQ